MKNSEVVFITFSNPTCRLKYSLSHISVEVYFARNSFNSAVLDENNKKKIALINLFVWNDIFCSQEQ